MFYQLSKMSKGNRKSQDHIRNMPATIRITYGRTIHDGDHIISFAMM